MYPALTIQQRLTTFAAAFAFILLALAMSAVTGLHAIDEDLENLEARLTGSTLVLRQIAYHAAEFRLAEADMSFSLDGKERALAEQTAARHRAAISNLVVSFKNLGEQDRMALAPFHLAWQSLVDKHDAWVEETARDGLKTTTVFPRELKILSTQLDAEVEKLNTAAFESVHEQAGVVDYLIHATINRTIAISVGGLLIACLLIYRTRKDVTGPLRVMTRTLTDLSQGNRDVILPALDRKDEIGAMAKAFDVFRSNALALEDAHVATCLAQEEAQMLARHDSLTGLPNRRVFTRELENAVALAQATGAWCSILMVDLDKFKPVNDTLGHAVGDIVLCEVAKRLRNVLGQHDLAARLGGDEFAVIVQGDVSDHETYVLEVAQKALISLKQPMFINGTSIEISATIGISCCPSNAREPEALLRAADLALYQGKRDGRGRLCWFEPQMEEHLRHSAELERDLRAAIENQEIKPFYQPLVTMKDGHIYGFEMLARWHHKLRGDVSPEVFVPLAEQMGLVSEMTWPLLRQACRDAKDWPSHMTLSVNLSAVQLKDPDLPIQLLSLLSKEGFVPHRLEVELTETALVADFQIARDVLNALREAGVKTALDDFGTGYSNLYTLRELNFDKIKIDRSFVMAMQQDQESAGIVSAVISLARSLGLPAVAEGVETKEIVRMLASLGCELGQGYHFGKPSSAAHALALASSIEQRVAQ